MKQAMIFAAGLGTRLRPLTDNMPKALVNVGGKPLIDHVISRLANAGFERIVVNVHHFADMIVRHLDDVNIHGVQVLISDETDALLETGGGLRRAAPLFHSDSNILIHNVDIMSNVDLENFYDCSKNCDANLLVSKRETSRYLLFDHDMRMAGWTNVKTGEIRSPYEKFDPDACTRLAFSGIHVVSPRLLKMMQDWPPRFGIIDFYLSVCNSVNIKGFQMDNLKLVDVGKIETLKSAEQFLKTI